MSAAADRPINWKPLIYCWRGGNRSGSMTTIFRAIGWKASQLEGGYKTWRSHVVAQLNDLPRAFRFRVICGATGSAKTRVLQALAARLTAKSPSQGADYPLHGYDGWKDYRVLNLRRD